jgi:hypothetical protein
MLLHYVTEFVVAVLTYLAILAPVGGAFYLVFRSLTSTEETTHDT